MQNFTPIGATVAEISVTGQRKKKTANSVPCHIRMVGKNQDAGFPQYVSRRK